MLKRIVLGQVLMLALGCSKTEPTAACVLPQPGTYILSTIDAKALPWTSPLSGGTFTDEITGGNWTLNAGLTYRKTINERTTSNGSVSTSTLIEDGTYVAGNPTVYFTKVGGTPSQQYQGQIDCQSKTLSVVFGTSADPHPYVFLKQ
jgi:hypothetical protein